MTEVEAKTAKEKTRYSDAELEEFRVLLIEKKLAAQKLKKEKKDEADLIELKPVDFKTQEEGSDAKAKQDLLDIVEKQSDFIDHLDSALERITNKTYGICRQTGKLIPKGRLLAVPHATLSVEAKNLQKTNNK